MTTAIIVQARMASTRLPGKVMLRVEGRTFLEWTLRRCLAVPGIDVVCCATVTTADCDEIAAEAGKLGVAVYRGDEQDVLGRYLAAAHAVDADVVMRVTSDCPLIDPTVCGAVAALRAEANVDYACNNMPSSWPHGLDCEVFTRDALTRSVSLACTAEDHEHVTPVLRRAPEFSKIALVGPGGFWEHLRWTLDTDRDLAFFSALMPHLSDVEADIGTIARTLAAHPEIVALNAMPNDHSSRVAQRVAGIDYTRVMAPLGDIAWADVLPTMH